VTILGRMRQDEIWDAEAAERYDTPGSGMFAPEVVEPAVDHLARLADGGRALEFAIGTGRIAVPLAERGVPVTGIEWWPGSSWNPGMRTGPGRSSPASRDPMCPSTAFRRSSRCAGP